jgi:hypothetical protein
MPCAHMQIDETVTSRVGAYGAHPPDKGLRAIGVYGYHAEQALCQRQRYLPARGESLRDKERGKQEGALSLTLPRVCCRQVGTLSTD